jgi:hypothetical protein
MRNTFSELKLTRREFHRGASRASEDMMDAVLKSDRLMIECYKVIAKANEVLERDHRIWSISRSAP